MKKVISKVLSLALAIMFIMSGIPSEVFNGYSVDAFAAENSFTENNFNVYESAIEPVASAVNWNKEDVEIDGKEIKNITFVGDYLVIETAGKRTEDPETGIVKNSAQTYLKNLKTGEIFELNATELFGYESPYSVQIIEVDGNYFINVSFDVVGAAIPIGALASYLTTDFKTYKKIFEFDDFNYVFNSVDIIKCGDTYVYTLYKFTDPYKSYPVEKAQCGSKLIYYTSEDLLNWTERTGPEFTLEHRVYLQSSFDCLMKETDSGLLFTLSYDASDGYGYRSMYEAQGLYYTDDFINYTQITNEKLNSKTYYHLGSTVDGKTIINTVEYEKGEGFRDEDYHNTFYYDNFIIWEFDEATKKLEEKYCIDTQIDSYTYYSGKSNYSNLIIEESDNRYFYNITPDASASFVVKYPFADLKMINGFRITDEEYCNLLTYFMSDGNFYITANGGKNFYEVKLPESFAEKLRNNNKVNIFFYETESEAGTKLYVYSGGNIISCSYSQLMDSVKTTAISHSFNEGTVTKQPNCTENGDKLFKCECGYYYSEDIPALGHN